GSDRRRGLSSLQVVPWLNSRQRAMRPRPMSSFAAREDSAHRLTGVIPAPAHHQEAPMPRIVRPIGPRTAVLVLRGFTLTALLVVPGVVTLLAAILFPVFEQAREAARQTRCLSNLRQLAVAHELYVGDYDEALPFWAMSKSLSEKRQTWVIWPEFLGPYF